MSVQFTVYPDLGFVYFDMQGVFSANATIAAFRAYMEHPEFDGALHLIVDFANATQVDVAFLDMMKIADRLAPYYALRDPASVTAFHAPDEMSFGVTRMYMSAAEDRAQHRISSFRTLREALEFTGLDVEAPEIWAALKASALDVADAE